jgi:hypothetical protein
MTYTNFLGFILHFFRFLDPGRMLALQGQSSLRDLEASRFCNVGSGGGIPPSPIGTH